MTPVSEVLLSIGTRDALDDLLHLVGDFLKTRSLRINVERCQPLTSVEYTFQDDVEALKPEGTH
jgi:hypothetical protein